MYTKLVRRYTDEIRIYQLLKETPYALDGEGFRYVLPLVNVIVHGSDLVFVVTPSLGKSVPFC